ncbi:MAG: hypothetical protein ACI8WB_001985 [Phenylobacterium sp.]
MKARIWLVGLMIFTVPLMARDWLVFDVEQHMFRSNFSQRDAAQRALEQKQYLQAMVLFKHSFQAVPSQKALTGFRLAFNESQRVAPPFHVIPDKDFSDKAIEIQSAIPLQSISVDKYDLPLFLFSKWSPSGAITTLSPRLKSYLSHASNVLMVKPLTGQRQKISLRAAFIDSVKRSIGIHRVNKTDSTVSIHIEQKVERLLAPYAVLTKSGNLRLYIKVGRIVMVNNRFEGEVYVALRDMVQGKTLAVKAFFNHAENEGKLHHALAQDIALFALIFE